MRRTRMLSAIGLAMAIAGTITAPAWAASSPTVSTAAATKLTDTGGVLNATVNPNGAATTYAFEYGPTAAYGAATTTKSAGSGTKPVAVSFHVAGLTPGTVYHFRITATNRFGTTAGADRAFTTTGHPPAGVATGPAVSVGKSSATITGTVNPEGAVTQWVVQYGLTPAYGYQTFEQALPAVSQAESVAAQLTGLASATLFHYRIVAFHGSVVSPGADGTFFTEPLKRPVPRLRVHTRPGRDRRAPYQFTTSGSLRGAGFIPAAQRCTGNVGVRYYNGRRQLAFVVAPVGPDCTFSAPVSFRRLHGPAPAAVAVKITFRGNGYVAPAKATNHVTAG